MTLPNAVRTLDGVPASQSYVPSLTANIATKGSPNTTTDANGTVSATAVALDQSLSLSATLQSAQTGNANGTVLSLLGMSTILFTVNMAAYTGTVNFEGTEDGTHYLPIVVSQVDTTAPTVALTAVGSTTTSIHLYEASCANLQSIQARTSSTSAGSVTVTAHTIPQPLAPRIMNIAVVSAGTLALESGGNLATIATRTPALGQATSANSSPVVIASDQSNVPTTQKPSTSGGTLIYRAVAASSNNAASIKGSAGQVYGWEIYNASAAARYVKLYNKASAPAPATDNGLLKAVIGIAAGQRAFYNSENGIAFSTGIGIAAVTGISDTDNTSTAANDLVFNIEYF